MNKPGAKKCHWLLQHWFFPLAILFFLFNLYCFKYTHIISTDIYELTTLLVVTIIIPVLYVLCYHSSMRRSLIRAAALAFLGVWLASKLVPEEQQSILIQLVPMRYIGIGVLFFIEIRLLIMMVQFIITHDANHDLSKQLAEKGDVPEWYAKLMTLEANFWRNVYQRLKHLLGG